MDVACSCRSPRRFERMLDPIAHGFKRIDPFRALCSNELCRCRADNSESINHKSEFLLSQPSLSGGNGFKCSIFAASKCIRMIW